MKLCKDCKFCVPYSESKEYRYKYSKCSHIQCGIDVVTGDPQHYCVSCRGSGVCGKEGKLFEQKEYVECTPVHTLWEKIREVCRLKYS